MFRTRSFFFSDKEKCFKSASFELQDLQYTQAFKYLCENLFTHTILRDTSFFRIHAANKKLMFYSRGLLSLGSFTREEISDNYMKR